MTSICGNEALRELSSPGKSGSFFYLSNDDRYMIKTMKKVEAKALLRMMPAYYNHFRAFENALVTKFYGLHYVKLTGPAKKKLSILIISKVPVALSKIQEADKTNRDLKTDVEALGTQRSKLLNENAELNQLDVAGKVEAELSQTLEGLKAEKDSWAMEKRQF
ncbi:hypothetical protein RJT34_16950 [Clitoria ternatea]|uniref:1-phosphatidylinositol-4-phosphate 5-kinase n=1 Tax=Clitoria ternatea TaxID=43366 RepID=A0AAN9J8B8_CLITE